MANPYSRLLVAIDFSDADKQVLERARQLAGQHRSGITLLHVVEYMPMAYVDEIPPLESVEFSKALEQGALKNLRALQDELQPLETEMQVVTGIAKHEVVRVAEEIGADLIVIGSHGRHGIQLLLGSTANGVLHLAKCDVLAVRVK
jgi:universal stress protein A